MEDFDDAD